MQNRKTSLLAAACPLIAGLLAFFAMVSAASAAPAVAPDHSLALQKYLDAGVPPIDRPWTAEDYQQAAKALETLAAKDITQLPRYSSENSGVLFAHIIAQENLSFFTNQREPVDARMRLVKDAAAYLPIFVLYAHAATAEQTFDSEILELGAFILRVEVAEAAVFEEFLAAHPEKKDDARTVMGLKQLRDSIAQTTGGLVELIMDRTCVRSSEATRFVRQLKYVLPTTAEKLIPDARDPLRAQLKQAVADEPDPELKTALTELLATLK